jgi:hypothetical protein
VAALVFEDCTGYDKLAQDASPPTASTPPTSPAACQPARPPAAPAAPGHPPGADIALLPEQHRAVAAANSDAAAVAAVQAIAAPLSRLVASGVLLRSGRANPQILADAVETASAQGWRGRCWPGWAYKPCAPSKQATPPKPSASSAASPSPAADHSRPRRIL